MEHNAADRPERVHSLFGRLSFSVLAIYFLAFLLMLVSNALAIRESRNTMFRTVQDLLEPYSARISAGLKNTEAYLVSQATGNQNRINLIRRGEMDSSYFSAVYQQGQDLMNALPSLEMTVGLFTFAPDRGEFIYFGESGTAQDAEAIRRGLRKAREEGTLEDLVRRGWFPISERGRTILLRCLWTGGVYQGAWTDCGMLFSDALKEGRSTPLLMFEDGNAYDGTSRLSELKPELPGEEGYTLYSADQDYVVAASALDKVKGGFLVMLYPESGVTRRLHGNYLVALLFGAAFLAFSLLLISVLNRYLKRPIHRLTKSIETLRDGDFDTPILPPEDECREFLQVDEAFNDMVFHIRDLKIDVYEERLSQQRTEMKFLKSQVAPHFMANCLNAMYHMSAAGQDKLVQQMALGLSAHLRYALAERNFVPLRREVEMAENYLQLFAIRFPGCLTWETRLDEGTEDLAVIPMSILPFVENTVKYELVMGQKLEVHIRASLSGDGAVVVTVWDTGSGWPEDVVRYLNSGEILSSVDGKKIGIQNTVRRGRLLCGDGFSAAFSNRPGAGAQIELRFPCRDYKEEQDGEEGDE